MSEMERRTLRLWREIEERLRPRRRAEEAASSPRKARVRSEGGTDLFKYSNQDVKYSCFRNINFVLSQLF